MKRKHTELDFWYAVNHTNVVLAPERHLETFGNTIVNYHLISELLDSVDKVRVREGRLQALRPQIITPSAYSNMVLEGFGSQAEKYVEWLRENEDSVRVLRYGYVLKQEAFSEQVITDNADAVVERVKQAVSAKKDPFSAVIHGVDDPWDVCLVRFFWQLIQNSAHANIQELNARRMFELREGIPMAVREEIEKGFKEAEANPSLIKHLGSLLQKHGVFEQFQDRFFALVKRSSP